MNERAPEHPSTRAPERNTVQTSSEARPLLGGYGWQRRNVFTIATSSSSDARPLLAGYGWRRRNVFTIATSSSSDARPLLGGYGWRRRNVFTIATSSSSTHMLGTFFCSSLLIIFFVNHIPCLGHVQLWHLKYSSSTFT